MRGCCRPVAKASIFRPLATEGVSPFFHPTTREMCIGGNRYCCKSGRLGLAPIWALGSPLPSLHAAKQNSEPHNTAERRTCPHNVVIELLLHHADTPSSIRANR